jgi:hypothetical protein
MADAQTVGWWPSWLDPANWLKGIGGQIGSGIEAGLVSLLKDVWDVILGPLEILMGVVLAILVLIFAFRNEIASIAAIAMK